jgi:hypothetical protein
VLSGFPLAIKLAFRLDGVNCELIVILRFEKRKEIKNPACLQQAGFHRALILTSDN